ncbi:MAG: purine-nucleoside phosphorylase, partial [Erysipelotrichaceae bacterium]|nr:purine-nucleoside phosphorylase [Erysipelotrichaceae bacterium]
MGTAHNKANVGDIANIVLMPGDPLCAKFIADKFLLDVEQFNSVRNMFGFTGTYNGKRVSVMGSGMGIPSISLYAYELYKFYGVDKIVRIGSTGTYKEDIDIYSTILATAAYSDSSFAKVAYGDDSEFQYPSAELNAEIKKASEKLGIKLIEGKVWSSDVFYYDDSQLAASLQKAIDYDLVCAEMESFGLFATAKNLG